MRLPFLSGIMAPTFGEIQQHADKIKECAWFFQQAFECRLNPLCESFDESRKELIQLKNEAEEIKHKILSHFPREILRPVNRTLILNYVKEQDRILGSVVGTLSWFSYRKGDYIPDHLHKDFLLLVDAVMDPFEEISKMVTEAKKYFDRFSDSRRNNVLNIIQTISGHEQEADLVEDMIKQKAFDSITDPITLLHVIRLVELIGTIADHCENAGEVMRVMLAG